MKKYIFATESEGLQPPPPVMALNNRNSSTAFDNNSVIFHITVQ